MLQSVASVAEHTNIDSHYRFYNYSRGDKLLKGSLGSWANATTSTVCSSFDWLAAVGAGVPLHPTALKLPGVPDGMRTYSVDTRVAGAQALDDQMYNKAISVCEVKTGGVFLLQAYCAQLASNVADQLTNCFASDDCFNTHKHWTNPGTGVAVSPDDILDWDTYYNGGTYGYNEPLVYQPNGFRHAYAWAAPPGSGSITVIAVHTNNSRYAAATVLINTNAIGTTDDHGTFQVPVLAAGNYEVGAQFDPCAATGHPNTCTLPLEQASTMAVLPQNESITVVLTLCAGPVVRGVVTSCPQPGSGPAFKVSLTSTFSGLDVCVRGGGFTPTGPVTIVYSRVPGKTVDITEFTSGDQSGNIDFKDFSWEGKQVERCTPEQIDGDVTVTAHDNVSDVAQQSSVPSRFWCGQALVGTKFNGGCP